MLQTADIRMRVIILILASTGARVGSLPGLVLGNLTKLPDQKVFRIIFYEGTNNEYYTFTTNECASSIDNYLLYRQRCGEKISFSETTQRWEPYDTPLLRLQFDGEDVLQARNPRPMINRSVREALTMHLVRAGIREVEHLTAPDSPKRVRKPVSLSNGFRKHVISTFIDSGLNHEIRELLVDHATGLDASYFRPTEDQVLREYLKAEPYLTIDSSARLAQENQNLKQEVSRFDKMQEQIDRLVQRINSGSS